MIKINANRTVTEVEYEFQDGNVVKLVIQSASTKEVDSMVDNKNMENEMSINEKMIRQMLCKNDQNIVDKVFKEQYEEGQIPGFVNLLMQIIDKEKQGKLNDLLNG